MELTSEEVDYLYDVLMEELSTRHYHPHQFNESESKALDSLVEKVTDEAKRQKRRWAS